ncbi:MAG: hypothetical protein HY829_03730 [Actinobacteria bacterium]|nr:hypothetical protein [Actinomycetota bacterium]
MTAQRDYHRIVPVALALVAAAAAVVMLTFRTDGRVPDYGVGTVPLAVPWVAVALVVVVALVGLSPGATSGVAPPLVAFLFIATGWSASALLFDALRIVRLVPLPLDGEGFGLRLLLLAGALSAAQPVIDARHALQGRCPACGRWRPGPLARIPWWPAVVGVVFALPYPLLRVTWLLGGTVGTTGGRVDVDPVLQLVMACAGILLLALATVLMLDRGPAWLRALLGLGGVVVGSLLAMTFAPAAFGSVSSLFSNGLSWSPGSDLMGWVFALFYTAWTLSGTGVALAGFRYWIHRRAQCTVCWPPSPAERLVEAAPMR